jgi:transcription elongation factor GreA
MSNYQTGILKLPKYMSNKGIESLKKKHAYLQDQLKKLRSHLQELNRQEVRVQEDHAWLEALESVHITEQELRVTERLLASVKALKPGKAGVVELGSHVLLQSGKKKLNFTLVTSIEADPSEQKISNESPIGQALIGKKEGERISMGADMKQSVYTIKKIS